MALVGRDAGVDGRGDEDAGLGRRDEERLRPGTPFGLFAVVVLLSFGSAILLGERVHSDTCLTPTTPHPHQCSHSIACRKE